MMRNVPVRRHADRKRQGPGHQHIVDALGKGKGRGASGWRHSVAIVVVLDEDVIDDGRQGAQRSEAVAHVRGQGKRYYMAAAFTDDGCARNREPWRDVDVGVVVVQASKTVELSGRVEIARISLGVFERERNDRTYVRLQNMPQAACEAALRLTWET